MWHDFLAALCAFFYDTKSPFTLAGSFHFKKGQIVAVQNGTLSLTRYQVVGRRRRLSFQDLNQEFRRLRLKPFRLKPSRREINFGWDFPFPIFGHEVFHDDWDLTDCRVDDGLFLRVRVEKRKVSSQLIQLVAQSRIDSEQKKRQGKPLGHKRQKALIEEAREELLTQSLPSIHFFDAYWKEDTDTIYLFTNSKANCVIFEELFRESFGKPLDLSLVKFAPPLLGLTKQEWLSKGSNAEARLDRIEKVLPEMSSDANY